MIKKFGQLISQARKQKELTARTVREKLQSEHAIDISSCYLTKIEIHDEIPSPSVTIALSRILDIDLMLLVEAAKRREWEKFEKKLTRMYGDILMKE